MCAPATIRPRRVTRRWPRLWASWRAGVDEAPRTPPGPRRGTVARRRARPARGRAPWGAGAGGGRGRPARGRRRPSGAARRAARATRALPRRRAGLRAGPARDGRARQGRAAGAAGAVAGRARRGRGAAGGGGGGRARVERVIGRPDVARDALEAYMLHRGLHRRFAAGVERAARDATDRPFEAPARRDLTRLPTFTIDPVTARDFDDAISAEALGDRRWRIWVHIADVSAFVRPGSMVDREAYRRATSVYVPSLVEPMLPEALSNDVCSLRPGADRLAVTVEMELAGADVRRASFYRSTIRSDERLDYDRVDRIFAG